MATARGYPYFLQEYGSAAWNVSVGPVITLHDATVGGAQLAGRFWQAGGSSLPNQVTAVSIPQVCSPRRRG